MLQGLHIVPYAGCVRRAPARRLARPDPSPVPPFATVSQAHQRLSPARPARTHGVVPEWIKGFIERELPTKRDLAGYEDRIVAVSGSDTKFKISKERAALGFAPQSMEAQPGSDDDLYDLMISTDVLAEGVNLQQCRHIINFDMPWNPMRLVQRHGRVDRIGSPHSRVFMRTIFPVDRLDRLLKLEQVILAKLAMAAASIGVATPIEGGSHGSQVFSETREEIEKLLREDPSLYERGGTAGAAQTRGVSADPPQSARHRPRPLRQHALEGRLGHGARLAPRHILLRGRWTGEQVRENVPAIRSRERSLAAISRQPRRARDWNVSAPDRMH